MVSTCQHHSMLGLGPSPPVGQLPRKAPIAGRGQEPSNPVGVASSSEHPEIQVRRHRCSGPGAQLQTRALS